MTDCSMPQNPTPCTKLIKLFVTKLEAISSSKSFNLLVFLCFNQQFPVFKVLISMIFPQRNVITKPFIPSAITPTDHLEDPKPFEAVLNWQTQNVRAQNETLVSIKRLIISVYALILLSLKWIRSLPRCNKFTRISNPEFLN